LNTQFLHIKDGRIAYEDTGAGPLVVCVPSMGDLRSEYRFLAPRLAAAGFRVVSMDVRGHGESSVEWPDYSVAAIGSDILDLIREMDASPAAIIGTSMAAGAVIWAAVEAPELINAIVLVDPFVDGDGSAPMKLLFSVLFARPWGPSMWARYYNMLYPTHKPEDFEGYRAGLLSNLKQSGRLEALMQMIKASKAASGSRLKQVGQPSLVIMGSKDPDFKDPEAEARRLAETLNTRYVMVKEAGHYPHAEMPEVTASTILPFLETILLRKDVPHAA
jgi:pimeloyl-ACP methyl ester carboxylesterase